MTLEEKNKQVKEIVDRMVARANEAHRNLIDQRLYNMALRRYMNTDKDLSEIERELSTVIENLTKERMEIESYARESRSLEDRASYLLDLGADKKGLYLSQQQVDLLMIVEIKSKEEMLYYFNNYCGQFPFKKIEEVLPDFYNSEVDIETLKRQLYSAYQNTLTDYIKDATMSEVERSSEKLDKLGVPEEIKREVLKYVELKDVNGAYRYLASCTSPEFMRIFNRFMRDDFENIQSVTYEEMENLSHLISKKGAIDTIIIATGNYSNSVFNDGTKNYFDPFYTEKAIRYCEKHGIHMRYHSLVDHMHVDRLLKFNINSSSKEQILSDLRAYILCSMYFIRKNNSQLSDGPLINVVEVFNELAEKNKKDKNEPYEVVWQRYFGITLEELMDCFRNPNISTEMCQEAFGISREEAEQFIREYVSQGFKMPGVQFMYNETTLTESEKKREEVEDIYYRLTDIDPEFIDIFGDQAHLSNEDLDHNGREIQGTAELLNRIQNGVRIDPATGKYVRAAGIVNVECSEHDFHFTEAYLSQLKRAGVTQEQIETIKKNMQQRISEIYNGQGVNFSRETYWSIFNKCDHNLYRANRRIAAYNQSHGTSIPFIESMYAGAFGDGDYIDLVKLGEDVEMSVSPDENVEEVVVPEPQEVEETEEEKKPFDYRDDEELEIAAQIRAKNQRIVEKQKEEEKEQHLDKDSQKKLVLKNPNAKPDNSGFIGNMVIIGLVLILVAIFTALVYVVTK